MERRHVALVLVVLCAWRLHAPAADWEGAVAVADPRQEERHLPAPWTANGMKFEPLARYDLEAVVLSSMHYSEDMKSSLAPVDLALGWGGMSRADVINQLSIGQDGRWYTYSWSGTPPLPPKEMGDHSANTHCIPANETVLQALLDVERHDLVTMRGYLVSVSGPGGFHWRSSTTRYDRRNAACEVFWVTSCLARPPG